MGRPPKFQSQDERHEARKRSRRAYYQRLVVRTPSYGADANTTSNLNNERKAALQRYHARKELVRGRKRAQEPEMYQPLPHTTSLLGIPAVISQTTALEPLLVALTEDLGLWKSTEGDRDAWAAYTKRLLRISLKTENSGALQDFEKRLLSAQRVQDLAAEALNEASSRLNCEEIESRLAILEERADMISRGLSELKFLFTSGGDDLRHAYETEQLAWQVYLADEEI
ncbi:hypothetical protein AURDEDRAFT_172378 [Auricularia subglabra TFB-10046 SS5]|nr:hypothetical protein AURDEDRAFT_172378 [Auricularia subglabra TFB-10046 SS5]